MGAMDETTARELTELGDLIEQARERGTDLGYVLEHVVWTLDMLAGDDSEPRGQCCLDSNGELI